MRTAMAPEFRSNPYASAEQSKPVAISLRDIGFEYSGGIASQAVEAIGRVDFDVCEGEFICILGPSGCGKSTLLSLIAGLERPTRGKITLGDKEVTGPGSDRGMVFQDYALLPWKTVRRNIELGPKLQGKSRAQQKEIAEHFIDLVSLRGFEDHYPHALSGGMRQRVAVARTLAAEPAVILMDEPFGALDALTRGMLQQELVGIWKKTGKTILFVTHSVDEAAFLADRVVVLTPRPSRIGEIVTVPTERSRRAKDISDIEHSRVVAHLAGLLQ
jgi:NitT/TauT family transport system ATP-binding protein